MPLRKIHVFQGCSAAVEDVMTPEGKLEGRVLVIVDPDTGDLWRYAMPEDTAKLIGQKLMGIGEVALANGSMLKDEIARHGGNKPS